MDVDDEGFGVLTTERCAELLRGQRFGRVALTDRALPLIVPVAFAFHEPLVLIAVANPAMARASAARQIVCFEAEAVEAVESVEGGEPEAGDVWSVTMIGQLAGHAVADPAAELGDAPWLLGATSLARMQPEIITARRYVRV